MASLWAWGVLLLVLLRVGLEARLRFALKNVKRHAYEFQPQRTLWFWCVCAVLNIAVFIMHVVLLGIFFGESEINSINYWFYSMFVYYMLQCYLAVVVGRQDRNDEQTARILIYASASALSLALVGLLYDDFCQNTAGAACNEDRARFYSGFWPIQCFTLLTFVLLDCLLWAGGFTRENCSNACDGYKLQFQKPPPISQYATTAPIPAEA